MPQEIQVKLIEEEMKEAYMDYAMSVIVSRALPDVRDGLKPVHRRILYTMHEEGIRHDKPFRKSAATVGTVIAKRHPHGDAAVYDALARMVQNFSLRYPLIEGHGNFGCFTGDTKIKLLDGTTKSFKELCETYKNGDTFYVYSIDKEGNTVVGEASSPRITKRDNEVIELTLDTGEKIKCTPDHKFLLKNLKYKEAKDLKETDSLMPGYFKLSDGNIKEYLMIKNNSDEKYEYVHDIADRYNLKEEVYTVADGPIRHHINYNKYDNHPKNIQRLGWAEHTKTHNDHLNALWKTEKFRKKQREGVKKFYKENPYVLEATKQRIINLNKDPEFIKRISEKRRKLYAENQELRKINSQRMKAYFNRNPEARTKQSEKSKKMWKDPEKRKEIIERIYKSLQPIEVRKKISEGIILTYKERPESIKIRAQKLKDYHKNNPNARREISKRSKNLWKDEKYRSKFVNGAYNHFSSMAKILWKDPEVVEKYRIKAREQWKDNNFRQKISKSISIRNNERLKKDPLYPRRLAQKASISHRKNWKNENYRNNIIRNKILCYVNHLINKVGERNVNGETYDSQRYNNCFPKFEKAMKYFESYEEMISSAKGYNHKIISIRWLDYAEDVYDITVKEYHNFLLDAGVFVHNSVEGFAPAAQRYTEARLSRLSSELLADIEKDTVDFVPNFDGTTNEPVVFPAKAPNLLVNGSSGIAVGMATNIPPHNFSEVVDATILKIENPEVTVEELANVVKGPDFPTAGLILNKTGIAQAYKTGRGKIILRAKAHVEGNRIVITEIPYQVNKTSLIESIADLVREKRIEGIADIRDESDSGGMSIVIETKRDVNKEVVLNQLYKNTQMQVTFGMIMLVLDNGRPKIMNLEQVISRFIQHRTEVITRKTKFELTKSEQRLHILEGLIVALENIDEVIGLIKKSANADSAREHLIDKYSLSKEQAQAILEMRLQRLTSLEQDKVKGEAEELIKVIIDLKDILASQGRILDIIKNELLDIKNKYGDQRRTQIMDLEDDIETEDLIEEEDIVITITDSGYIKQIPLTTYRQQRRGGLGIRATTTKEGDVVEHLFITNNHNNLLFFTNKGRVYWLKAYQLPEASRQSKGKAIVNLLDINGEEKINTVLPISNLHNNDYLLFVTKKGLIKKTLLSHYSKPRKGGIIAINLREDDELVQTRLTPGNLSIILGTRRGFAIRFNEAEVTPVGRSAAGVRAIKLREDEVIGMEVALDTASLFTITENGYGKRTDVNEYKRIRRGGKGVINIQTKFINPASKNGGVVGIKTVKDGDELMLISKEGIIIRISAKDISNIGRNTQGVRIMKLKENDKVVTVARVITNNLN